MLREEYSRRILEKCPVDYYLSANDGARVKWPFRMQPTHESSETYANISEKYAIDSAIMKPELGNKEALEKAIKCNADFLLLSDYLPFDVYREGFDDDTPEVRKQKIDELESEYGDNFQASLQSIKDGMKLVENSDYEGECWIPLQKPHREMYDLLSKPSKVAIGGIKDDGNLKKVEYCKELREYVGQEVYIHALGVGVTKEVGMMIRKNPKIVDSIDSQTPLASANHMDHMQGKERLTPTSLHSLGFLFESCRRMTDLVDEENNDTPSGSVFDY